MTTARFWDLKLKLRVIMYKEWSWERYSEIIHNTMSISHSLILFQKLSRDTRRNHKWLYSWSGTMLNAISEHFTRHFAVEDEACCWIKVLPVILSSQRGYKCSLFCRAGWSDVCCILIFSCIVIHKPWCFITCIFKQKWRYNRVCKSVKTHSQLLFCPQLINPENSILVLFSLLLCFCEMLCCGEWKAERLVRKSLCSSLWWDAYLFTLYQSQKWNWKEWKNLNSSMLMMIEFACVYFCDGKKKRNSRQKIIKFVALQTKKWLFSVVNPFIIKDNRSKFTNRSVVSL